jgi:hypothetical protein
MTHFIFVSASLQRWRLVEAEKEAVILDLEASASARAKSVGNPGLAVSEIGTAAD